MPAFVDSVYQVQLQFTDRDNDAPIDLSDSDLAIEVYGASCRGSAPTVTLTEGNGIDVSEIADGMLIFTLNPSQMTTIGAGEMRLVFFTDYSSNQNRSVLLEGLEMVEAKDYDA